MRASAITLLFAPASLGGCIVGCIHRRPPTRSAVEPAPERVTPSPTVAQQGQPPGTSPNQENIP